ACLPLFAFAILRSPRYALFATIFLATTDLELAGTLFGDWAWVPAAPWTHLPSGNPPSAIAGGYCVIDGSVARVMGLPLPLRGQRRLDVHPGRRVVRHPLRLADRSPQAVAARALAGLEAGAGGQPSLGHGPRRGEPAPGAGAPPRPRRGGPGPRSGSSPTELYTSLTRPLKRFRRAAVTTCAGCERGVFPYGGRCSD